MDYLFKSERLGFRPMDKTYLHMIYKLSSDNRVMEYFLNKLSLEDSKLFLEKIISHYEDYGYSLYGLHLLDNGDFIGFIGLLKISFDLDIKGETEIGWRLFLTTGVRVMPRKGPGGF